ncbi:hypothetical protein RM572_05775 [Streptomyces sp. DSM 42041]|uniref:MarR family transcriptional regulator n=1 Tax=Streptomyces hazeniae TaxID=3075538 RepID=A0ABU2NQI4_9ACTN|nr:hypothetical protein [Streptomyces sp. DSM 42041]MDT0378287.1 hypothetical protein [Streptomyces sp. DSM 42041]
MLRHVIPPARAYAQIPNTILRHPRLSPDAKTLLTWQLSLPASEAQCLSDTARRAGIKKCAFQKAKRQLLDEGYLHQWTLRADGGRFLTVQLVANTPLSAKEALAARDGHQPPPGDRKTTSRTDVQPPSAAPPAPGQPTRPAVGRLHKKNTRENTTPPTNPTPEPADEPVATPGPGPAAQHAAAHTLLLSLGRIDPQLALPARTAQRWAPLAAPWLDSGLSLLHIRHALTDGLEGARNPLGALHWRLRHALPDVPPPPPATPATPAPEPRLSRMRECTTRHDQPRLFTPPPGTDETRCPACRTTDTPTPPPPPAGSGYAEFTAARQSRPPTPRPTPRPRSIHRHRRPR